jgi:myo-inositol-1-phosphate synthase
MVNPSDFVISGWDISGKNLYDACKRAKVLEPDLLNQLKDELTAIKPLPATLNGDYIAANQADRADNIINGNNQEIISTLRQDIRNMKEKVDKVIVLWSANTEMYLLPEI